MKAARWLRNPLRRATFVACLLFAQAALVWHHVEFDRHEDGRLCLTCLAGANLDHGHVSLDLPPPSSLPAVAPAAAPERDYLPRFDLTPRSRGPPESFLPTI